MDASGLSHKCAERLIDFGVRTIAFVAESHDTTDIAVQLAPTRIAVVRFTDRGFAEGYSAVEAMVDQGDFVWGALVHCQGEPNSSSREIQSFHVSQLDQLVARLLELQEAWREAG